MKKLVLLVVLAFAFNHSEIKAQSIVLPGEDIIANVVDVNATDVVLENKTTGEIQVFNNTAQLTALSTSISAGNYKLEYTANNERIRINNISIN